MNETGRASTPPHSCSACILQRSLWLLVRSTEPQVYFETIDSLPSTPRSSNAVSCFFANADKIVQMYPRPRELFFLWVGVECYTRSEKKNGKEKGEARGNTRSSGDFPGTISPVFITNVKVLGPLFSQPLTEEERWRID